MPSRAGRPPEPPVSGWATDTRVRPVDASTDDTRTIATAPELAAGMRPGSAWAGQPSTQSMIRKKTAARTPHAAAGPGLTTLPSGSSSPIGRTRPELYGIPRSRVQK